jgi:hypothetical protein
LSLFCKQVPKGEQDFDWSFCDKKIRLIFYNKVRLRIGFAACSANAHWLKPILVRGT